MRCLVDNSFGVPPRPARGFTLVELMVAIAMFSILALAIQSTVLLATKAIPDAKGPNANQLSASRVADRITAELTYALSVTEITPTAITFTVADRNSDGVPETIRYAWSGVAGTALTRQYNGGTAATVLDDVRELNFAFDKRSQRSPTSYTESAESLLYSYTGGIVTNSLNVDNTSWRGQYFVPTLPNNISSWRITRVRYLARYHGPAVGETRVQIRTATSGGLPTGTVIDQARLLENTLGSSFAWCDSYFSSAGGLSPNAGACVVFRWMNDADSCDIQSVTLSLALGGGQQLVQTGNAGSSWNGALLQTLPLYVYGTTSTQNPDTYQYFLTNVRMLLRCGSDPAARVNTAAQILSQPEVTGL